MNRADILNVICGFGLLLFSLRVLTRTLDAGLPRSLRMLLAGFTSSGAKCIATGAFVTAIIQASSATVLTAMGFLSHGLLTLEQGMLLMLGATIGTTLKSWFILELEAVLGPLLVGLGSLGYFAFRRSQNRRIFEMLLAIGLSFLGLSLTTQGLAPLAKTEWVAGLLSGNGVAAPGVLFAGAAAGFVLAVLVQSSSTIVALAIDLAVKGVLPVPVGIALVLGANAGTTSTALFASIEHGGDARRLAVGHFVAKALGVILTLLFLRSFFALQSLVVGAFTSSPSPGIEIAAAHTIFNIVNSMFWWGFMPVLLYVTRVLVPSSAQWEDINPLDSEGVQKLLVQIPDRGLAEARNRVDILIRQIKWMYDGAFVALETERPEKLLEDLERKRGHVESRLASLQDLLARLANTRGNDAVVRSEILRIRSSAERLEIVYALVESLSRKTRARILDSTHALPRAAREEVRTQRARLDPFWNRFYESMTVPQGIAAATNQASLFNTSGAPDGSDALLLEGLKVRFQSLEAGLSHGDSMVQ